MMRGIRRLVVYAAVGSLLTAGAVTASTEVAHANFAAVCGGNLADGFVCNLDATTPPSSSISITVTSRAASERVDVTWTVTCADGTGSMSQLGATDNAATPLTVALAPLPRTAADGQCTVNASAKPDPTVTAKIDFTGELDYTPVSSATASPSPSPPPVGSTGPVHPIRGFAGKCVDDNGNSSANRAKIQIWPCSGTDQAENWRFTNGELVHNGKCMNDQFSAGSGGHVILFTCNGAPNEKWTELANGELKLQAHGGTLCLDDPRSSTTNGTQLIVFTCKDSPNQKWALP